MPDDVRAALPALIDAERQRCAPMADEPMLATITQTLALVGGSLSQDDRVAYQLAACEALAEIPADLAADAMKHARRVARFPGDIIPAVFAYVEDYPARRRKRLQKLITLARLADTSTTN